MVKKVFSVYLLFLGFFSSIALAAEETPAPAEEHVVTLTKATFDAFINTEDFAIVEFFAPWCGHCKRLAPEYEAAAKILKESNIKLAKVDVTAEEELATRFDIKGYPTLKIFRKGKDEEYAGGRTTDSIVQYVYRMTGPAIHEVKSWDEATAQAKEVPVAFVGYFNSKESEPYLNYRKVADKLRTAGKYLALVDEKGNNTLFAIRQDENKTQTIPIESEEGIKVFVTVEKFPLFGGIDTSNYADYFESGKDMVWVIGTADNFTSMKATIRQVAPLFRSQFHFVWLDSAHFKEHATSALGVSDIPAIVLQIKEARYMYDSKKFDDVAELRKFVEDAVEGKIERHLMSEPIPEDTQEEAVKVVVGKNMIDKILDKTNDVFLEIYAPWCGHCKQFAKIYTEFAEAVQKYDHVKVYKMDGTKNESPDPSISWQGFPTIFFISAKTQKPVVYDGPRTLEGLLSYLKSHGSKPIDISDKVKDEF